MGWWLGRLIVWEEELHTSLVAHSRDASRRGRWRYLGDKDDCTPREDAGLPLGSMLRLQNSAELSAVAQLLQLHPASHPLAAQYLICDASFNCKAILWSALSVCLSVHVKSWSG